MINTANETETARAAVLRMDPEHTALGDGMIVDADDWTVAA